MTEVKNDRFCMTNKEAKKNPLPHDNKPMKNDEAYN
jgi:hypothetical protein